MKKSILTSVLFSFIILLNADSFYEQLCKFNPNWKKYSNEKIKGNAIPFNSDQEYIQAHLTEVIKVLKRNPVSSLNKSQKQMRFELTKALELYKLAGKFPMNYYLQERTPVFIDEHGTHCAVGHLLQISGYEHLAQTIAKTNNYAWVKEIKITSLLDWQNKSGFTVEELKLIQGAYNSYLHDALFRFDRYIIPQKPEIALRFFDHFNNDSIKSIWCKGEGKNGVLHGKWTQNQLIGNKMAPWIIGFFKQGKKTGQWKEYYQGTKLLCRTEHWLNDTLNGVRTRFDRQGRIIETLDFKDGIVRTKTNTDFKDSLIYIRKPIDNKMVKTQIYTFNNELIGYGKESIENKGNLLWFQNIELTTLNSIAISARDIEPNFNIPNNLSNSPVTIDLSNQTFILGNNSFDPNNRSLVKYNREGNWAFNLKNISNKILSAAILDEIYLKKSKITNEYMKSYQANTAKISYSNGVYQSIQIKGNDSFIPVICYPKKVASNESKPKKISVFMLSVLGSAPIILPHLLTKWEAFHTRHYEVKNNPFSGIISFSKFVLPKKRKMRFFRI